MGNSHLKDLLYLKDLIETSVHRSQFTMSTSSAEVRYQGACTRVFETRTATGKEHFVC